MSLLMIGFRSVYEILYWICLPGVFFFSGKEKIPGVRSVKKAMLLVFWDMKGPITTDFLEKEVQL